MLSYVPQRPPSTSVPYQSAGNTPSSRQLPQQQQQQLLPSISSPSPSSSSKPHHLSSMEIDYPSPSPSSSQTHHHSASFSNIQSLSPSNQSYRPTMNSFESSREEAFAMGMNMGGLRGPVVGGDDMGFDEGTLRNLCDLDCGLPLLLDRLKQSLSSTREFSSFLKKRSLLEEEYGRSLIKLSKASMESYSQNDCKAGSFVSAIGAMCKIHEVVGEGRIRMAERLGGMGDELANVVKEADKQRKINKEVGARLERSLIEAEMSVDKARLRFDSTVEDLERLLLLKSGESPKSLDVPHSGSSAAHVAQKKTFGKAMSKIKGINSGVTASMSASKMAKVEEEMRGKMNSLSEVYRKEVVNAQKIRGEWFRKELPRILRTLKDTMDELDLATQYHMTRYAYLYEKTLVDEGLILSPLGGIEDGPGLKAVAESIDNREDFKNYMQNYVVAFGLSGVKGPRREGPVEEGYLPSITRASTSASNTNISNSSSAARRPSTTSTTISPPHSGTSLPTKPVTPPAHPTFGVDLAEQLARDNVEIPKILEKCCEVIETYGLDCVGIYRLSGTTSRVQKLKMKLDRDIDAVNLTSEENLSDINDITGVLKLWIRELPEPICTFELYEGFIEAAKIENDRLRRIRIHERVNDLPDANYATLRYLIGHLHKVRRRELVNQMSVSNLAIVFGPNLLSPPPGEAVSAIQDMPWQCRAVETILEYYREIFVEEEGGASVVSGGGESIPGGSS